MSYPTGHRSTPRLEAIKAGRDRYEGGPCKHCLTTTRYVSSGSCVMCNKRRSMIANLERTGKPVPPEVADPIKFGAMVQAMDEAAGRAKRRFLSGLK